HLLHEHDSRHLLERLRLLRTNAFGEGSQGNLVGSHLTVLWDDPERPVIPEHPAPPEEVVTV
ncbi:MAG: hypothetical protein ACRDQ5_04740, partial [Sciscionella sp.]